jgi:hypothetical protein
LHRQIASQFQGRRMTSFVAMDQAISHGRDITWTLRAKEAPEHIRESWDGTSWIVEMTATGTSDGRPFQATHLFLTSLRTTPEALLQLVRDRRSIQCWHWICDTQLHEDAHRYNDNGLVRYPACELHHSTCCGWLVFSRSALGFKRQCTLSRRFWRWRCVSQSPRRADTLNQP